MRYVFLPDGRNYSLEMIRQGYGHEYTYNIPHRYQTEFKQAQAVATRNQRGLWAEGACVDSQPPAESSATEEPINPVEQESSTTINETSNQIGCHLAYEPRLPIVSDLNCPDVSGPIRVKELGVDPYSLDRDRDGVGCE